MTITNPTLLNGANNADDANDAYGSAPGWSEVSTSSPQVFFSATVAVDADTTAVAATGTYRSVLDAAFGVGSGEDIGQICQLTVFANDFSFFTNDQVLHPKDDFADETSGFSFLLDTSAAVGPMTALLQMAHNWDESGGTVAHSLWGLTLVLGPSAGRGWVRGHAWG